MQPLRLLRPLWFSFSLGYNPGNVKRGELRDNVGQLVIMGCNGVEPSPTLRALVAAIRPAGVILFVRNIVSAAETWELLAGCQAAAGNALFRCVDLEGGTVDRLRQAIAPAPAAAQVFASADRKLFRRHGRLVGDEVRALGFNTDFAPVLDLAFPPSQAVLTTRVVSRDPGATTDYAREFLRGLGDAGVLGCGKHFPGLGEAALDTHHQLPSIRKSWSAMWREDLAPYRALRKQLPFVMVAHAAYPEVTRDRLPASLSSQWMTDILRKKIGYPGLVISDDLEMGGVLAAAEIGEAAVATLRAGADLFLVCHSEEQVVRAWEAVLGEAERDRKFAKIVSERARRVRKFKSQTGGLKMTAKPPTEREVDKLRIAMEEFARKVGTK